MSTTSTTTIPPSNVSAPGRTVADIMNPKLLYIHDGERASLAKRHMLTFGVTVVPVLDETHRPVGMISLRDLELAGDEFQPSAVVFTVRASDPILEAARKLAASEHHHLVVVDDKGVAVGMVSSIDFLRAMLGMPHAHPKRFEQF